VGLGLYTEIKKGDDSIHICNVHGVAYAADNKLDNPARLEQSRVLIDFFGPLSGQKIIGGDFNILPDTDSIRAFATGGYVDLIKQFNIQATRNRFSWDLHPGSKQYYSDYVFISPDVKVQNFVVPQNEISDHLPIILDIEN